MSGKPNDTIKSGLRLGLTFGLGAWLGAPGYIAGGVLGSVLFPPDAPEAPDPYTALNLNTAEEGSSDPLHYGVNKVQGNFIYKGPLRSRKIEEGGKGGQKTVTGYKYWTWAALGIGRGIVDITRMWKNDDITVPESNSQINIYRGTADQIRDPDWDLRADDVVPLKREAYIYFNNYYLGEDNNSFPTTSSEVHRFPWYSDMDAIAPYVLNKVSQQSIGGDTVVRDKHDDILVFTQTEMKVYNSAWVLQRTLDMTPLSLPSYVGNWDVCLTYNSGGNTQINLIVGNTSTGKIENYIFGKNTKNLNTEKAALVRGTYQRIELYTPSGSSSFEGIIARSNNEYIFIAEDNQYTPFDRLHKVAFNGKTLLASYDLPTLGDAVDMDVNNDFVFWAGGSNQLTMLDFTGNILDTTNGFVSSPDVICAMYGSPCIIGCTQGISGTPDYDSVSYVTYDRDTQLFVSNTSPSLDLDETWWGAAGSPFVGMSAWEGRLMEGANGTMYLTGHDTSDDYFTMELILDANPAHIMYDLFTNTKGFNLAMVDAGELEAVGTVCFDNRIGMSFSVLRKRNVGAVIRDILGHIQAHPYQTPVGKFGFFMPNPNDALAQIDPITAEDILSIKNDNVPDMSIISTSMKDVGLCPNRLNVVYENRLNQYKKDATFQLDDMLAQDQDGIIIEENLNYQMFSNPAVISKMAWKAWKIGRFQNQMHTTVLNSRWLKIRQGEVYLLNIPDENLNNARCRVFSVDDPPVGVDAGVTVNWMMDDEYLTSYEEIDYDASISEDTSIGPPEEVIPLVWEEDARYNNDVYTMCFSAIRETADTAYCDIWASLDAPDDFFFVKRLTQFGNVGDLVSNIVKHDKRLLVNTDAYEESTFATYTKTNQRNNISYCLIGEVQTTFDLALTDMEFMTYREAVAIGGDLQLRELVRGKDYTIPKDHTVANKTKAINVGISYNKIQIPSEWIGKKIYFKFIPYNLRGDGLDEADVETYEYTIMGWTRKATHADRVQIEDNLRGPLGHRTKTGDSDVKIIWQYTNRNSGMGESTLDTWEWHGWQAGDVDDYDIIIFQADGVTVQAEHLGEGVVDEYIYTDVQNAIDFGGVASDHYWVGIRPVVTGRGVGREGFDIVKQEVERI